MSAYEEEIREGTLKCRQAIGELERNMKEGRCEQGDNGGHNKH